MLLLSQLQLPKPCRVGCRPLHLIWLCAQGIVLQRLPGARLLLGLRLRPPGRLLMSIIVLLTACTEAAAKGAITQGLGWVIT